jgi:serine-type D-Ala-D-Ala carboxypeptidase/endopeptidase (penicillin-binding protein 4)
MKAMRRTFDWSLMFAGRTTRVAAFWPASARRSLLLPALGFMLGLGLLLAGAPAPAQAKASPSAKAARAAALRNGPAAAPRGPRATAPTTPLQHLPAPVQRALAAASVPPEALAAVALPLGHSARGWGHRANEAMQPASTMKLVTSMVALDRLGPNHRGYTELRSAAPLDGGVLRGDVVLRGGADSSLTLDHFWALLMELQLAGVQEITGDVIVDRTLFQPARMDLGAPPFDKQPEWRYNAIPDALNLMESLLPIEISSVSGAVVVRGMPALQGVEISSTMALSDRRCADWDEDWLPVAVEPTPSGGWRVQLRGLFPRNCTQRENLGVLDRQALTEAVFRTLWASHGGRFTGRVREAATAADVPSGTRVLARRTSRPWGEVLRPLNKTSDNALTRLLFLSLGTAAASAGASTGISPNTTSAAAAAAATAANAAAAAQPTLDRAGQVVREWFTEQGISTTGLVLDNASGLSRSERISPQALAQALRASWQGRYASDLMMSLPTAAEDGTLRNRLKGSPAAGWARLKTGTLKDVTALAGYARDEHGRLWAVAMMLNHERAAQARPALDALIDGLARGGADSILTPPEPPRRVLAPGQNRGGKAGRAAPAAKAKKARR